MRHFSASRDNSRDNSISPGILTMSKLCRSKNLGLSSEVCTMTRWQSCLYELESKRMCGRFGDRCPLDEILRTAASQTAVSCASLAKLPANIGQGNSEHVGFVFGSWSTVNVFAMPSFQGRGAGSSAWSAGILKESHRFSARRACRAEFGYNSSVLKEILCAF